MTNTYETSDLPLGTTSAKALYNNASNLDEGMNSLGPSFADRFGRRRETWAGMETALQDFLVRSAFVFIGDYAAGLNFTARNQYTIRLGIAYRLSQTATLPYVTTGVWATDAANFVAFDSDAILRTELADDSDTSKGAGMVGYKGRTAYDKFMESVSISDFGGDTSAIASVNSAAIAAAVAFVQASGGGLVHIPRGNWNFASTFNIAPLGTGEGYHNVMIVGDGSGNTFLDFSAAVAGSDGIAVHNYGGRFVLRGFRVKGAPGIGVNINAGESRGGQSFISEFVIDDVKVSGCGSDGIRCLQTYLGTLRDIDSAFNGGNGINLQGFHTSMQMSRVSSSHNTLAGWFLNGLVYSTMDCCTSDWNGAAGYSIHNIAGLKITGGGAESNGLDGYQVITGTTYISGIPVDCQDINCLTLDTCLTYNNSKAAAGAYANSLSVSTSGGRHANLEMKNCNGWNDVGGLLAVYLGGVSGSATLQAQGNKIKGTTVRAGSAFIQNDTLAGRSIMVTASTNIAVATNTDTIVLWDAVEANRLGAAYGLGAVTIPEGVNRIKVTAGLYWAASSAGSRIIRISKNGGAVIGLPQLKVPGIDATGQAITTAIIEVNPGDLIRTMAYQDAGGTLAILSGAASFMSVECIG